MNNGKNGILMEYESGQFNVSIEKKNVSGDKKLRDSWGDVIYRLCLETKNKYDLHKINIKFKAVTRDCHE